MELTDTTTTPIRNYADNEWLDVDADDGKQIENPATGESLTTTPYSDVEAVDEIVASAAAAYPEWRETPIEERLQPLFRLKALLEDHQDQLAEVIATEHGKTVAEARGELRRGIENVEVACGAGTHMQAGHLEHAAPAIDETASRQPLGVFAAITPFNFPGMIPLWFLPYAVATGNTFVLKPSERTPCTAQALFRVIDAAGFPEGVLTLANGGPETVDALLENDDIVGVSFVGSTPIARHVYETAAANGKRVQAQGGAKNHVVVSDSANLEFAAEQTISSAFANTGQRCLANPVAVVHDDVYEEFVDRLLDHADLTVGDGRDEETEMGPLISDASRERVIDYIEAGFEEGATLLLDGRDADVPDSGHFLGPTVFGDVDPDGRIATEEIFGPILALIRAADFDEALSIVNGSEYGNAASLFTERGREASRFRHECAAGNLGINVGTAAPMAFFHFGGERESFFGDLHAQGDDAFRFYTDERIYIERWPDEQS